MEIRKKTNYGLAFIATDNIKKVKGLDLPIIGDYNKKVMEAQKSNCGFYILDAETRMPIDDEYDLSSIYQILSK